MKPSTSKPKSAPKRVLRLADLDHTKVSVLKYLGFAAIATSLWDRDRRFRRMVVLGAAHRIQQDSRASVSHPAGSKASSPSDNQFAVSRRASARLRSCRCWIAQPGLGPRIRRVKGAKRLGVRLGNWLSAEQAKGLLRCPSGEALIGKRDRAILALLLGCGLRRSETARLALEHFQRRDDHWAIVDLFGKGGHIRSVPVPDWVKTVVDHWTAEAHIESGSLFRCVTKYGTVWGENITEKVIWHVVRKYAMCTHPGKIAPHDLRRTCARLCHEPAASWNKSNSYLVMSAYRQPNNTWAASNGSDML